MEIILKIYHKLFDTRIEITNLVLLFCIGISIGTIIKHRLLRFSISSFLSILFSMQLVSLYFVGTFIGYQFYVHFNVRDINEMSGIYQNQILLLLVIIIGLTCIFHFSKSILEFFKRLINKRIPQIRKIRTRSIRKISLTLIILGSVYFMNIDKGLIYTSVDLYSMLKIEEKDLSESLQELGINQYTNPSKLITSPGKNVIILSLESLEKGYLIGDFKELTPNLNKLKDTWTYLDMKPNAGSEWTSGSLYTNLTGFPAYFGVHGNSIFQKAYHTNITGISHIFEKLGYDMKYITSSNAEFSGTEDLLNTFKINNIIDQSQKGKSFRDKDLFEEAKKILKEYKKNDQQFALFLSTFDTHFPDGIYDERMEEFVEKRENQLDFMVSSIDYLVKDFVSFLEQENFLSNTVIYIFPDHLKMGNTFKLKQQGERSLYIMSNAEQEKFTGTDNLYQLDLPRIILEGADIEHNATFWSSWITETNKDSIIKENIENISALNNAGIQRLRSEEYEKQIESKFYKDYKKDTSRFIAHAGGQIDSYTYTNSIEALNKSYENGFRFFELDIIKTKDDHFVAAHDWEYWKKTSNFKRTIPPTHKEFLNEKIRGSYSPLDMDLINNWFATHPDAILITDKVNTPKEFSKAFIDKDRLWMELFSWDAIEEAITSGIEPIVSENVINDLESSALNKLLENSIEYVAVSKFYVEENKDQIKNFKKNGIKVYVFNLNFGMNLGEDYYIKYKLDDVYGIYSDTWTFKSN